MSNPNIMRIQRDLIAEFTVFDNWVDRYQYLIDLGRQLPPFPERWKTQANRVHDCQAQVWLHCRESGGRLVIQAISDTPSIFIKELGLETHISPTRSNGLHVMLNTIMHSAADFLTDNTMSPHRRACVLRCKP